MATYCIGDIHACFDEFMQLLELINFNPEKDRLYLTGDIIGRGPKPLDTMDYILEHNDVIKTVLGNHDLNLICVSFKGTKAKEKDNISSLLKSKKLNQYLDFLMKSSLLIVDKENSLAIAHAGIYPLWSIAEAENKSNLINRIFSDPLLCKLFFINMYGDIPIKDEAKNGLAEWRFIVNAYTRMRFVDTDGRLDYKTKTKKPEDLKNSTLKAWFDMDLDLTYEGKNMTLVFGHWAALQGQCRRKNIIALDTACVWGGSLSAFCIETKQIVSVASKGYREISSD